jgi:hypothetical protein
LYLVGVKPYDEAAYPHIYKKNNVWDRFTLHHDDDGDDDDDETGKTAEIQITRK